VLGAERSWLETIASGQALLAARDWRHLSAEEINILLGYRKSNQGAWGLLGSMKGAAKAVGLFLGKPRIRDTVRKALDPVLNAEGETAFIKAACRAIENIAALERFGTAIATRFITLARPDMAVSVNAMSAGGFASLASVPATAPLQAHPRNYEKLLRWIYEQPWYSASMPSESMEREAWSARAALLDCFVYLARQNL
jgi:hypothetical protein